MSSRVVGGHEAWTLCVSLLRRFHLRVSAVEDTENCSINYAHKDAFLVHAEQSERVTFRAFILP